MQGFSGKTNLKSGRENQCLPDSYRKMPSNSNLQLTRPKTQNTPHHASCKRTVRGVRSIMRLSSDTRSRQLSPHGQRRILRCRWYWKAVCPAPDTNRKRICMPTCRAACLLVPPPWRTAAQLLLRPARRGSPRWVQSWNCWQREAFWGLPARLPFLLAASPLLFLLISRPRWACPLPPRPGSHPSPRR